jgi:hypothetical protein
MADRPLCRSLLPTIDTRICSTAERLQPEAFQNFGRARIAAPSARAAEIATQKKAAGLCAATACTTIPKDQKKQKDFNDR